MKKTILLLGCLLSLVGVFQTGQYILDYDKLTRYGRGYYWGSVLLIILGLTLIYLAVKKKNSSE